MSKNRAAVEPVMRDNILVQARVVAKVRKIKLNSLSTECHGDPPFLHKLSRRACSFTVRKYDAIMLYFDKWFADNPDVKRPAIRDPFPEPVSKPA